MTVAPISAAAVDDLCAPFGSSRTLPGEAYVSAELFDWERRHLFGASWVCTGRSTDLGESGDATAVRAGAEAVLLVRDGPHLRAFHNVCRHRGHELLPCGEQTSLRAVRCPYHSWVYSLDGTLRTAPRFSNRPGFDPGEFGLVPVHNAEWNGWAFVNASGDAHDFDAHTGALTDLLAPWEIDRLVVAHRHGYTLAANWKLVVENYLECYHCPTIHPELTRVSPPDSGDSYTGAGAWIAGNQDLEESAVTMSLSGQSGGVPLPRVEPWQARRILYAVLLPNLLVSAHPDYVLTHRLEPLAPDETRVQCEWLFPPEAAAQPDFDPGYAVEFWDLTNRQDWSACEGVQRSTSSRGFRPGPLAPDEEAVYHFLATLGRAYRGGRSVPRDGPARPVHVPWEPDRLLQG